MTAAAIDIHALTRTFGRVRAVDDLTLSVAAGEVFGFLGHNGAGKTTTVRLLNGVLKPDHGTLTVLGFDPQRDGKLLRARTGVLTETPSLEERLTARDSLLLQADLFSLPRDQIRGRVRAVLEQFGLADRAGEPVGGFSKGMKQRLALARAFLHQPELIFLDEPTAGLDPVAAQEVHEQIRHVSRDEGRTVFLCTHNLIEAQRLCDRVAVVEHGRLVAVGTAAELAREVGVDVDYTLEIGADQGEQARLVLSSLGVAAGPNNHGRLSVKIADRETVTPVLAGLIAAGIRVYAVVPGQTSLEDIYMTLHKHREAQP